LSAICHSIYRFRKLIRSCRFNANNPHISTVKDKCIHSFNSGGVWSACI
jgi:hypothetical protein